jgi:hypothetical protein
MVATTGPAFRVNARAQWRGVVIFGIFPKVNFL